MSFALWRLIGAAAFGAWHATWKAGIAEMRTKGADRLALHREGVLAAVERYRYLPFLLSQDSVIRRLLKNPADQPLIDQANRYLARANAASNEIPLMMAHAPKRRARNAPERWGRERDASHRLTDAGRLS